MLGWFLFPIKAGASQHATQSAQMVFVHYHPCSGVEPQVKAWCRDIIIFHRLHIVYIPFSPLSPTSSLLLLLFSSAMNDMNYGKRPPARTYTHTCE